ncbi:hypothetical protein [Paenibacillus qinlingensis]|uniref:hypothetical protein n=1 Tax=Paenibacillus qinlingensis TaxID=1837343 RepID=UPI0015645C4A|nr:hypothetical protein [Paenibacillus qinlingensis]NQX64195.1 hypothetical protein [Paenibacillus qinlingensis]
MKKWVFGLVLLLLLGYVVVQYKQEVISENLLPSVANQAQVVTPQMTELKVTKDQVNKGNLLLVNKDNPVPPQVGMWGQRFI